MEDSTGAKDSMNRLPDSMVSDTMEKHCSIGVSSTETATMTTRKPYAPDKPRSEMVSPSPEVNALQITTSPKVKKSRRGAASWARNVFHMEQSSSFGERVSALWGSVKEMA